MDQTLIDKIDKAAAILREAEKTKTSCPPIREILGSDSDLALAYAVQAANRAIWMQERRQLIGRKVAVSSPAAQKMFGITSPAFGMLYADMLRCDGVEVKMDEAMQPRLEVEVAVVLGRDLDMPRPTFTDALRAVEYVLPAIEIVGCRIRNLDTKILDLVADNAGSGLFVLGSRACKLDGLDLRRAAGVMRRGNEEIGKGTGANVLGHPINALAWLAAEQVRIGLPLREGDVVMTGTFCPMILARPGDEIKAEIEGLGFCELRFAP